MSLRTVVALVLTLLTSSCADAMDVRLQTIAATGVYYPEVDATLSRFRMMDIGGPGQMMFHAELQTELDVEQAIFRWDDDALATIVRTGDAVPEGDGKFRQFLRPMQNALGDIAFSAQLTDTPADSGIYLQKAQALHEVVREGEMVSGVTGPAEYYGSWPQLSDAGIIALRSNSISNRIYRGDENGLTIAAPRGLTTPTGGRFNGFFSASNPLINSQGEVAFWTGVDDPGATGVYRTAGSGYVAIATRDNPTSDGRVVQFAHPNAMLPDGRVVVAANYISDPGVSILIGDGVSTTVVAETGDLIPQHGVKLDLGADSGGLLGYITANRSGDVAFAGLLAEGYGDVTSENDLAVIRVVGGEIELLVQEGDAFDNGAMVFRRATSPPAMNDRGSVIFVGELRAGASYVDGLFASVNGAPVELLVATGDSIEVTPGVHKTITELSVFNEVRLNGGDAGWRNTLNEADESYFWAEFADESQALFLVSLDSGVSGDFSGDGVVDGLDFLIWQRDPSIGSLSDWEANYGASATTAAANTVPEPRGMALALVAIFVAVHRRR
ncbi:DUF7453 family protein [Bythopirellula goksoeyrii]|uniref:Uncharacterized protein n=1 Tax=Bythopirellula goksoeyrii TaxID=1400387 RepID=A0A5B9QDP9_9BACT|nr:choice-of-anchor tandem repeat NxxGxxAF-containing protein [Bythopirellula goksoeyrii]QEG35760.1 hypothetical protein Pr1d_30660 [Bythopirellula goksoeyrii]